MTVPAPTELAILAGAGLVALGLGGMLLRRSVLVVVMSVGVALLGAVLALVAVGIARGDAVVVASALVLLAFGAAFSVVGAAVALTTYRRRGTENLDELRELR